jgi:large subunit ribosomal protein L30
MLTLALTRKERMMAKDVKTITVEQYTSAIRRPRKQAMSLTGLGLKKLGDRRTLKDTPEARGMIATIAHMVRIVDSQ